MIWIMEPEASFPMRLPKVRGDWRLPDLIERGATLVIATDNFENPRWARVEYRVEEEL